MIEGQMTTGGQMTIGGQMTTEDHKRTEGHFLTVENPDQTNTLDLRASEPSTVPTSVTRTITRRSTRTITPSTMTIMKSKKRRDEIIVIQRFVPNSSAVGHSNNRLTMTTAAAAPARIVP